MSLRETLRKVLGVAVLESRWVLRQPMWIVQEVFTVVAFMVILYAWGGVGAVRHTLIAFMVASGLSLGLNVVGQEVGWKRITGMIDMLVASPVTPRAYIIGALLGHLIFAPAPLAVMIVVAVLLNALHYLLAGFAAMLLLTPTSTALGLAIAMRIEKPTNIAAITNPISFALMMLPPVFYPAAVIPEPFRLLVVTLVPTGAAAEFARSLVGLSPYPPILPLTALIAWLVASMTVAARSVRWGLE
ncbi:ABC-2 type transporter [Pyrolobus fumarii 1A]|uniref:ABC-2 type transporter n=1 Tax=Pyrolobus fumarii (strain DSM 11204 / 1A) TaxID=694429 RepID=G0EGX0_PYRF1|nr:ABC transporter permease [Pyrolobus fumarii]AEM38420.1 ABC-2 type transporter [Pyrolobus fumarii 1A]